MAVLCPDCKSENTEDSSFCRTRSTSLEPAVSPSSVTKTILDPRSPSEGEKLFAGRYQILSTLGCGSMGEVYKVHDHKLQEDMALKLLRPEIANDPDNHPAFSQRIETGPKDHS